MSDKNNQSPDKAVCRKWLRKAVMDIQAQNVDLTPEETDTLADEAVSLARSQSKAKHEDTQ